MNFTILELFNLGGFFMWPLLGIFTVALVLIVERGIFFIHHKCSISKISEECFYAIKNDDFEQFKKKYSSLPYFVIFSSFYKNYKKDQKRLEESILYAAEEISNTTENGLDFLNIIINLSPLVGFLGTVSGMISAFASIANADEVNTQLVASGIFEALITTVFGLIIAVITTVFVGVFDRIIANKKNDIQKSINTLESKLIYNDESI